jgi:pimeloyl-ACP methyl ester carboxylesterase
VERGFTAEEPVVDLTADPRFVLRRGIESGDANVTSVAGEPFSHRSRKWHVYPFTAYPDARPEVHLAVDDPRLAEATSLWLFGPLRSDGTWDAPQRFDAVGGVVDLPAQALAPGQYALVVGPRRAEGFLPRYPSSLARLRDETGREVLAQVAIEDDGSAHIYTEDDLRFEIESPRPGTPAPAGGTIAARDASGRAATFELLAWSSSTWFLPEDARGIEDAVLGNLDGVGTGILSLNPSSDPADEEQLRLLWAIGEDGQPSQTPVLLSAVPETVDGRAVRVEAPTECTAPPCARAVFADDGSAVPETAIRRLRTTAYDFDETSTYGLEVRWVRSDGETVGAARAVGSSSTATRWPVYFAHGFNSSAAVWTPVIDALRAQDATWQRWARAGDVPPFEPVDVRAEVLRRHLTALLRDAPAANGERFQRINVVAHSMGGLDMRFLMGSPRYNEECGALACTDARGQPEACCPSDRDGRPVPWRERIASVTTLSTPHCGSSFADLGVSLLAHSWIEFGVELVLEKYFGLDQAGREAMRRTVFALSTEYCRQTMMPSFPLPEPSRRYDWACATGQESCASAAPAPADAPVREAGSHRLPSPTARATVFSWASQSCVTGNCGDALDPGLLVSYLRVKSQEGVNDGVVSTQSARFGIFMGIRANDHFHWNRTEEGGGGLRAWLFGARREPPARFHQHWLGELARAGY